MNGLLLALSPESKDIKFNPKKIVDTEDGLLESESKFFQNLMEELLHEMPDSTNKDFLIGKILDLPEDFVKKEKIRSSFSDEKLFTDHQINKVSIESMIKIASFLKSHPQEQPIMNFPTDSKALQTSLLDLNVQEEFKNARTISDLLKIAKKNKIEIKNFTLFKEESALDTHAKEMVKKINSEEIFKLMDKSLSSVKQIAKNPSKIDNILKDVLVQNQHKAKQTNTIIPPQSSHEVISQIPPTKDFSIKHPQTKTNPQYEEIISTPQAGKKRSPSVPPHDLKLQHKGDLKPGTIHTPTKVISKPSPTKDFSIKHPQTKTNPQYEEIISTSQAGKKRSPSVPPHDLKLQHKSDLKPGTIRTPTKVFPTPDIKTHTIRHTEEVTNTKNIHNKHITNPTMQQAEQVFNGTNPISQKTVQIQPEEQKNKQLFQNKKVSTKETPASEEQKKTITPKVIYEKQIFPRQTTIEHKVATAALKIQTVTNENEPERESFQEITRDTTQHEKVETLSSDKITVSHETKSNTIQHTKLQHFEPKKTFHSFVEEFKAKVESYKPPLMKIKMQLNPGNLGDVDVTLINRGNNLQVNINSNPNTIALFVQNQTEFKNSLINMGFTGLQMNFGENKDGQRGQNHKQNSKNNEAQSEELHEIDSFEMIVPRYV